jgi:D-cysteine desulfhydrase
MAVSQSHETPGKISLARLETPIERHLKLEQVFNLSGELWIKRDDMTGIALSGNKVRKLEFLLHDAQLKGCQAVITCGGIQSNHCRATAVAAARLGLGCTVVLRGEAPVDGPLGNLLINHLVGAQIRWVTPEQYSNSRPSIMEEEAGKWASQGKNAYIIPEGGSNGLGSYGYVECAREIAESERSLGFQFDAVTVATGSGGTAAGLAAGRDFYSSRYHCLALAVCDDNAYFEQEVGRILDELDRFLPGAQIAKLDFDDSYKGIGYAQSTPTEERFLQSVARNSGLILDPAYTCKALLGVVEEMKKERFGKNPKVLFIHTGGIFGTLAQSWTMHSEKDA